MTVKKVTDYVDRCAYLSVYAEVGCVAPCLFHYGGEEDWRVNFTSIVSQFFRTSSTIAIAVSLQ